MKKIAPLLTALSIIMALTSCDPDVTGQGVTLPEMKFAFKVSPDTASFKVGDTITFESSISSFHGGVQLTDGDVILGETFGYNPNNPITSSEGTEACLENEHVKIIYIHGDFTRRSSDPNYLSDFITHPQSDSIRFKYQFVLLKKGTYHFSISPSVYEKGSKGKAGTSGFFDVANPHWDLVQIPGVPTVGPSDPVYKQSYLIGVSD